jgi:DNA-binding NarL/FixJ family response regulator
MAPIVAPVVEATATAAFPHDLLSSRERDVVSLALEGATNAETADRLGVSLRTVKESLRRAFSKLGVRNRKNLMVVLMFAEKAATAKRHN